MFYLRVIVLTSFQLLNMTVCFYNVVFIVCLYYIFPFCLYVDDYVGSRYYGVMGL